MEFFTQLLLKLKLKLKTLKHGEKNIVEIYGEFTLFFFSAPLNTKI
jgi:hypothetical protein